MGGSGLDRRVVARAPAKVNLALLVGDAGPDGYHDVVSVFQAVSLFEEVTARPAPPGAGALAEVSGPGAAGVPTGAGNSAVRAAILLAERAGVPADVRLEIRKGVPVAGGMAGGSADAAAALVACDALWGLGATRAELAGVAAQVGADVPFCLLGGTALGTGRGDQLSPVLGRGEFHWVLALADGGLSTPAVYAECDRLRGLRAVADGARGELDGRLEPAVPGPVAAALRAGDAAQLGAALVNDLQEAACSLRPALRRVLALAADHDALGAVVSGSGPTVALLVDTPSAALELAIALTASGLAADVKRVTGPVPGARVVDPLSAPHRLPRSSR